MITITKAHFKDNENTKWTPNKNHHTALMYTEATQREPYNNQTQNERTSMTDLREREDIIITKADKGGAVVFVDVKDYIKVAERQLNNTQNYRKLQEDPTEKISK